MKSRLIDLGCDVAQWVSFLAPVAGLGVFWLAPFKPAVTLYALIVGLGMVLLQAVEDARVRREIQEIGRRQVHDCCAR